MLQSSQGQLIGRPNTRTSSLSSTSTSLSSSFSSAGTSVMQHADSSQSDIQSSDQHSISGSAHGPLSNAHIDLLRRGRSPSNPSLMGHTFGKPNPPSAWNEVPPHSEPSKGLNIATAAVSTGFRLKRAFAARRKNKSVDTFAALTAVTGEGRPRNNSVAGSISSSHNYKVNDSDGDIPPTTPNTPKSAKLKLHLAAQVFTGSKKGPQPPDSPLPPPPPPKPMNMQLKAIPPPIVPPPVDHRSSIITVSPGISSAVSFIRSEEQRRLASTTEAMSGNEVSGKTSIPDEANKEEWRRSDSTITHTMRPGTNTVAAVSSRTSRPVSTAESLQSTHTIVPSGRRRSTHITGDDVPEEGEWPKSAKEQILLSSNSSPAHSVREKRRSRSLNLNASPMQSMPQLGAVADHRQMPVTRPPIESPTNLSTPASISETPTLNRTAAIGIIAPTGGHLQSTTTNIRGRLAAWTATASSSRTQMPSKSPNAKTSAASGPPATGLAKRAVEKLGRWGGFSSASPNNSGYSSSSSSTGPSSYSEHGLSRTFSNQSKDRSRRTPDAPSGAWSVNSSIASSSDSDPIMTPSGPDLGELLRPPLAKSKPGAGLVFGKELHQSVRMTAIWAGHTGLPPNGGEFHGTDNVSRDTLAPLESRMLPAVFARCAQHILIWGVQEEGLFRVSGRPAHVSKLRAEFDSGADYDMQACSPGELDPHAVASVFKAFLRELPDPILTRSLLPYFEEALTQEANLHARFSSQAPAKIGGRGPTLPSGPKAGVQNLRKPPSLSTLAMPSFSGAPAPSKSLRNALRSLIQQLPEENRDTLRTVTELIKATAKESRQTKMPLSNLLLVFCPSLNMNPPLLRVLCEADDIWSNVSVESPVLDIKRESVGVLDISSTPSPSSESKENDSSVDVEETSEVAYSDAKERSQEESNSKFTEPLGSKGHQSPKDKEDNTLMPGDEIAQSPESELCNPFPSPLENSAHLPLNPHLVDERQPDTLVSEGETQVLSEPSSNDGRHTPTLAEGTSSDLPSRSSSKRVIPRNRPMGPRRKGTQGAVLQDHESGMSIGSCSHPASPSKEQPEDAYTSDAVQLAAPSNSSSSESLSTHESSGPETPNNQVGAEQDLIVDCPVNDLTVPIVSSSPEDHPRSSIQFPRSSDSAPTTPLSPRRSFPLLSMPSLKGEVVSGSPAISPLPSPRGFKRVLKPSLLFSRRSSSSLSSRSSPGRPTISAPYLNLPASSASDLIISAPAISSSSTSALPSGAFMIDTEIDSSSLSAGFGLDIELASAPETGDINGIQDFPVTPYPPGSTPAGVYRSELGSPTLQGSLQSLLSPSEQDRVPQARPVPARQTIGLSDAATASRLELLDTEDSSEWTKSVLMDFDLSHLSS